MGAVIPTAECPLKFEEARHVYTLNGIVVPSVTTVLRHTRYVKLVEDIVEKCERGELAWFEGMNLMQQRLRILDAARDRGRRVHKALHYLNEGDLDPSTLDEETQGYIESARKYLETNVLLTVRAEMRVWSSSRIFAGTLDWLALHRDGFLSIDDAKTGDPSDVAADLQTAAYLGALLEMAITDPQLARDLAQGKRGLIRRRSVRLFKDGRMAEETAYSNPTDYQKFLNALNVVHDQARRPMPIRAWDDER